VLRRARGSSTAVRMRRGAGLLVAAAVAAVVSYTGAALAGGPVTGRQIKDGSVGSVDLRTDRGATGADVRDGTLTAAKMRSLPQGPDGAKGPPGVTGLDGLDNFDYEISGPTRVVAGSDATFTVPCAAGTVLGGGASSVNTRIDMEESHPLADGTGWTVAVYNASGADAVVFFWADCVSVP
jgi:hypothetical protein